MLALMSELPQSSWGSVFLQYGIGPKLGGYRSRHASVGRRVGGLAIFVGLPEVSDVRSAIKKDNAGRAPGAVIKAKRTVRELSAIAPERVKLAAHDPVCVIRGIDIRAGGC